MVLCTSSGCPSSDATPATEQPASRPEPAAAEHAPTPAPAPPGALTFDDDSAWQKWPIAKRGDDLPVCLFSSWDDWKQAEFIERVKPSASLRAGHAINFGVFGPGCAAPECVREPTLQCWVDVEGKVITLHTRYSAFEKPGATCSRDCLAVTAQCNTPLLEKGEYQVVHGADSWKVRVPSTVRPACRPR